MVQKRLGRGLDSLISSRDLRLPSPQPSTDAAPPGDPPTQSPGQEVPSAGTDARLPRTNLAEKQAAGDEIRTVPVGELAANPYQPRKEMNADAIADLARSIATTGILQPIVAREVSSGLQIVAGERRWRAARVAGLKSVPVIVREVSEEQMLEWALVENIQREDLNAIERAGAYRQYAQAFGLSTEDVALRVGEDRSTVANYLRLLDLPEEVKSRVAAKEITMGHARALLGSPDQARRTQLANQIVERGLSVRTLENIIRSERMRGLRPAVTSQRQRMAAHLRDLERRFEETIGTKVRIVQGRSKGSGRVIIEYYNLDDFDRISQSLGLRSEVETKS